jgi:hypothetical protein
MNFFWAFAIGHAAWWILWALLVQNSPKETLGLTAGSFPVTFGVFALFYFIADLPQWAAVIVAEVSVLAVSGVAFAIQKNSPKPAAVAVSSQEYSDGEFEGTGGGCDCDCECDGD